MSYKFVTFFIGLFRYVLEVLKPKMYKISPEICLPQNIRQNKYIKQEYIDEPTENNVNYDANDCQTTFHW